MLFPHPLKQTLLALALAAGLCAAQAQDAPPDAPAAGGGGEPPPDAAMMAAPPEGEMPPAPEAQQTAATTETSNGATGSTAASTTAAETSAAHVYQNDAGASIVQTTQATTTTETTARTGRRGSRRNGQGNAEGPGGDMPAPPNGESAAAPAVQAETVPVVEVATMPVQTATSTLSFADQGPEETLVSASPFLSPLYAMRRPAVGLGARAAASVEFRGAVCLNGQWQFSLYDPREKRGFWVRMDDETAPYRVSAYNAEAHSISLNVNGMVSEVFLNRPVDTPMAIAATGVSGARAGGTVAAPTQAAATGNRQGNAQNGNRKANAQGDNGQNAAAAQKAKNNAPASGVYVGGQTDSTGTQVSAPVVAQPAAAQTTVTPAAAGASGTRSGTSNTRRRIVMPN